jgi:uncharacterized protein (DUF1499 family)
MNNRNAPWLAWLAYLALAVGAGIGLYALAAPLGVWLGLWEFGTGFQMLFGQNESAFTATNYGLPIATAALIIAIAVFVLAKMLGNENGLRLAGLSLISMVAAAIAYYVPASYRPGPEDNVPPIHDISTDTNDPPRFVAVLPLRADAPNPPQYGAAPETPETLAAQQHDAYPDIVSLELDEPPDAVFDRALAAAESLGWEIIAAERDEGRIEATDTTFWFRFKDDIVIRIRESTSGTVLDARSKSRVGRGDAGKNAARLRAFFDTL